MGGTGEQSSGSDLLQGAAEGEEGDQGGHLQGISITTLLLFLGGIVFSRYGMDNHLLVKGQEREEVQYPLHHCLSKHFEVFEHLTRFMDLHDLQAPGRIRSLFEEFQLFLSGSLTSEKKPRRVCSNSIILPSQTKEPPAFSPAASDGTRGDKTDVTGKDYLEDRRANGGTGISRRLIGQDAGI